MAASVASVAAIAIVCVHEEPDDRDAAKDHQHKCDDIACATTTAARPVTRHNFVFTVHGGGIAFKQ